MKKYLLLPGMVRSRTDGDQHFIDAPTLARLYGVKWSECVVSHDSFRDCDLGRNHEGLICLEPRFDGNYTLPVQKSIEAPSVEPDECLTCTGLGHRKMDCDKHKVKP